MKRQQAFLMAVLGAGLAISGAYGQNDAAPNAPQDSKLSRNEEINKSPQLQNEQGFDLGWIGLLGLAGFAGLMRPKKAKTL